MLQRDRYVDLRQTWKMCNGQNKLMHDAVVAGSINNTLVDMAASPVPVTICKDGSYCCGNGTVADACCKMDLGLFVVNGSATPRNSALSVASRTASSSQSSSSPTSPTSSLTKTPARKTETGTIVGGTVGGVAVLVLGALIWKILDRRKLLGRDNINKTLRSPTCASNPFTASSRDGRSNVQEDNEGSREMDGAGQILELNPERTWYEML